MRPTLLPEDGLALPQALRFVTVGTHRLETRWIAPLRDDAPVLVFLHEGLGCIDMWRDFPARVAAATGCAALLYSRYGYGRSTVRQGEARGTDYLHVEALDALPALLDALGIHDPVLIGHSDGGSIALIHAARARRRVRGVVAMAPHEFVEDITLAGIRKAREMWELTDLRARLGRFHDDPDGVFLSWNDTWQMPAFRTWNIVDELAAIACPVLAIQGEDDEYATLRQIEVIAEHVADTELLALADCRHSPHRDQPQAVIEAIARFVVRVQGPGKG